MKPSDKLEAEYRVTSHMGNGFPPVQMTLRASAVRRHSIVRKAMESHIYYISVEV